jgi:hypothetical protein
MNALRDIVRRGSAVFAAMFCHLSVATTLLGYWIARRYGRMSWNPEWGPELKWFFERQREYVYAIEGAFVGAIFGIVLGSIPQIRELFKRPGGVHITRRQLLFLAFLISLGMLCVGGYLQIRNAPVYLRDPDSRTDFFLQWNSPLPGFFNFF